ncbi:MAG TPA: DUF3239 domain-containing protein [Planctomycetota bacterium]|nr:DUF3239 domain-containing protein [Planctomycetota bacterium]
MINKPTTAKEIEAMLAQLTRQIVPMMFARKGPEEIQRWLISEGMDEEAAQSAMRLVITSALAAMAIRQGKSRAEALAEMGVEGPTRALAERLLDVAIEEVAKHPFDTVASNPGGVDLQWMPFLKCNAGVLGFLAVVTLIIVAGFGAVAYFVWQPAFLFVVFAVLASLWLTYRLFSTMKIKFKHGCANPAVIVSTEPCLIAVMGNLSNDSSGDAYNVIKILPADLNSMNFPGFRVGARVATVALYTDGGHEGRWADFEPEPVNCATTDFAAIDRVLNSFSADDWRELDEALGQVPDKTKPGLYPVSLPKQTLVRS